MNEFVLNDRTVISIPGSLYGDLCERGLKVYGHVPTACGAGWRRGAIVAADCQKHQAEQIVRHVADRVETAMRLCKGCSLTLGDLMKAIEAEATPKRIAE